MQTKRYYAQEAGWILGEERRKGAPIDATEEEAKYALLNGTLGAEPPPTAVEQKEAIAAANTPVDEKKDGGK